MSNEYNVGFAHSSGFSRLLSSFVSKNGSRELLNYFYTYNPSKDSGFKSSQFSQLCGEEWTGASQTVGYRLEATHSLTQHQFHLTFPATHTIHQTACLAHAHFLAS